VGLIRFVRYCLVGALSFGPLCSNLLWNKRKLAPAVVLQAGVAGVSRVTDVNDVFLFHDWT